MKFLRRSLVGLFLVAVTIGLMAFAGSTVFQAFEELRSDERGPRLPSERIFAANVVVIVPEAIRPMLSTFGEVRSRRVLVLRASAGGEVIWLSDKFEEGGAVDAGELLARIDPSEAQSAIETAGADLAESEADLRDAERSLVLAADEITSAENQTRLRANALTRQQDLLQRGAGSTAAVETAELALASANQVVLSRRQSEATAEARIDQIKIALLRRGILFAEAERRQADTQLAAEFAGVLSEVSAVKGGLVSSGDSLAELIDPAALEVAFRISTPQYSRFLAAGGQLIGADVTASIGILGVDLETTGTISRESASVAAGQTGRLLFAHLDDAKGFRPGDFVSVSVKEPELQQVARLPATAVDAASTVLIVDDDERLEEGKVEVLRREKDNVIVRALGLSGREVVAERTPLLGVGIKIRPIRPGNAEVTAAPELLALDPDRRAKLVAFVENSKFMPVEAKRRVLAQLREDKVPARVVERIESRMGG